MRPSQAGYLGREADSEDRFNAELAMMKRLGATPEEPQALRDKLEKVEMYTRGPVRGRWLSGAPARRGATP